MADRFARAKTALETGNLATALRLIIEEMGADDAEATDLQEQIDNVPGGGSTQNIRVISAPTILDPDEDHTIICDVENGAGGNINLPAGQDNLEFQFGAKGTSFNNDYVLVLDGSDQFDGNVPGSIFAAPGAFTIQFKDGFWYRTA